MQAVVATLFQGRLKVVAVKARREGSHSTNVKLCKASGGGEGMRHGRRGVTQWVLGEVREVSMR